LSKRIHAALLINIKSMLRKRGVSTFEDTGMIGGRKAPYTALSA
jgi:hypothetical protein